MVAAARVLEVGTSLLHAGSLSIAVAHIAEHDFVGALIAIAFGSLCVITLTSVVILCELARWCVSRYLTEKKERVALPPQ